ncbi:hypothetical protein [Cryptosporangium japonicum]
MDLAAAVALAHHLLSAPLPGSGYRIVDLEMSDDFYGDDDYSAADAAWAKLDAERVRLVDDLTERWGAPERLELQVDWEDERRTLMNDLAGFVTEVWSWRRDGRQVCVGVGQDDKELPVRLVLGVGDPTATGAVGRGTG